jgi:DNA-binding NarL/FixJ family response regulator
LTPARVYVVAPSPMSRAGLRSMLAAADEVEVVGEAASGDEVLDDEEAFLEANVVLVAGEREDVEAVPVSEEGGAALVALGGDELLPVLEALALRGWGLLPADASAEELSASLLAASRGLVVLPSYPGGREARPVDEPSEALTPREAEILELLGRGLSNKLIAHELHISEHTVKFHISSLYAKLGVANRAGAVSQGARRGLIPL